MSLTENRNIRFDKRFWKDIQVYLKKQKPRKTFSQFVRELIAERIYKKTENN